MTLKSKKLVKFKNISHGYFGKKGGVSNGNYSALNCGPGNNDKISNVKKNLKIVSKKFKVSPKNLILLKQIHSNKCHFILKRPSKKLVGDGLITTKKNLALGILTADCAPVLIYDKKLPMIAAIHVGWKGAFKNILKKCIKFMIKKGSENQNIDITHHINFNFINQIVNLNGLKVGGITNQGSFLKNMGIDLRAEILSKKMSFLKKTDLYTRIRRLTHKDEMGELFKVMFVTTKDNNFKTGFNH